jgi:hypothetical protein
MQGSSAKIDTVITDLNNAHMDAILWFHSYLTKSRFAFGLRAKRIDGG